MSLEKLIDDKNVQEILKEKLEAGEEFELISLETGEKVSFEELKQNIR